MAKMTTGRWLGVGAAVFWLGAMTAARGGAPVPGWSAEVARVEITPDKPVWMAGYAARKTPSESVAHPILSKALALSDGSDRTAGLVTADLIGFDRELTGRITDRLRAKYGLSREAVALFASHTHTGPAVKGVERHLRESGIDPKQAQANLDDRNELEDKIVALVGSAPAGRELAALAYGVGRAGFAMSRRGKTAHGFKIGANPGGPTDRASYEDRLTEPGANRQAHARRMLAALDQGRSIEAEYPYPVQAFAPGDRLTLLALFGEVAVDYALRLQKEFGGGDRFLWVAAYANDDFGYVPSVRVLNEGDTKGSKPSTTRPSRLPSPPTSNRSSSRPPAPFVYDPRPGTGSRPLDLARHVIDDGGIGTEDLVAADLDGDGRPDLVAGGRSTHNVKIYRNHGPGR